ncbi:holo-ACP synthase [Bifidobacterium aquikefiricola]|uniref:Holo-ACP synthase n=1 Tax=Bifidobacterium aquikefiricola TaxID=3059038 RepID=A0AB39U5I0_9BIFI
MSEILGLGHDVVDVDAFAQQWREPSSTMRKLFSVRELRQCTMRAALKHDDEALHAAARWAGKESVIKAWSEALADHAYPYSIESVPWHQIEILDDSRGRPRVMLAAPVAERLIASQQPVECEPVERRSAEYEAKERKSAEYVWHVSLSHDGGIASAVVLLCLE